MALNEDDGELKQQEDFVEDYSALHKKLRKLDKDLPVAQFIKEYLQDKEFEEARFTLKNYVEGYYAADTARASTFALRDELSAKDEEQYRIEGGYAQLFDYLYNQCLEKGVQFFFSEPVHSIQWKKNKVEVAGRGKTFMAKKIMITVPVGVLQSEKLQFVPAIPEKIKAAKQLGYGPVIKTMLEFDKAFWKDKKHTQHKDLSRLGFIFSRAVIPTWWTAYPKEVAQITGWSGGPNAEKLKHLSDTEILETALQSLGAIFNIDPAELRRHLKAWLVANWTKDPFSCGAYSYEVVNGNAAKQILKQPVEGTIFFAGEGLFEGPEIGTVNAALVIGRDMAHQLIASF